MFINMISRRCIPSGLYWFSNLSTALYIGGAVGAIIETITIYPDSSSGVTDSTTDTNDADK